MKKTQITQKLSDLIENIIQEILEETLQDLTKNDQEISKELKEEYKEMSIEMLKKGHITKEDLKDILEQHSGETLIIAEINEQGQAQVSLEYQDIHYIVGLVSGIISAIAYQEEIDAIHILNELTRIEKEIPVDIRIPTEVAR